MSPGQNQGQKSFRVPPQNLEAEKALLGSIMLRPETLHEIVDIVNPAIFYSEKHSLICKTILELWSGTNPVDLLSVSSRLKETAGLDKVGGTSYIADLVNVVPSAGNVRYYAELVNNKYLLRRLIDASHHIMEMGFDEAGDLDEILDRAEKKIFEVTNMTQLKSYLELKEALGEAWERLDALHKSKAELRGITTGFRDLDNLLAGFQKSDLIILAARPSMGKTALALDIARQTAVKSNTSVCIFSLEMSAQQLVDRMLAAEAQVNSWNLRTGRITSDDDFLRIRNSLDRLSTAPIYIDDMPGNNILKMRSVARRVKSEKNLGLIVVDYLQLMVPTNSRGSDSTVQQVTEISRSLKNLARELDVPVLALSQLNRAVEQRGGRPRLSDLRDSGCLAGDTLLTLADSGRRVPIRELAGKSKIRILAMNTDRKIQSFAASKIFASGTKQIFELSLRSGRFIKASANHQFLTLQGWKRLDELTLNEKIVVLDLPKTNEQGVAWDEIRLISPLGQEEVFDATVPGAHNFVANDIVVHNSIEQDADVVMFIHREDKYKEDSSRPNIAEILVEKHRNGPVGKIELYFDDKKTTFVNLEKSDFSEFSGTPGNQGPQEVGAF